ncbi:3'-5' exonuclease isoform X2 [Daucus carota subsp. sativus]|uniref:3'-5' exonuclease isoform X2 n=1 Tax=Daucus carota subsp. sativus TaxID=79200 RepID=UPI003083E18D
MENQQPPTSLLSDLDQPFTDEELKAIDAAFEAVSSSSSTSSVKKLVSGDSPSDPRPKTRRRLPESVKESIRKTPLKENNLRSSSRLKWLKNLDLPSQQGVLPGKAAVMQICGDANHCHVMHIIHSGIPLSLKSLLEDPSCIKVGVNVGGDANKVYKDHNVSVEALQDLSSLANQKLGGKPKRWSLGSLTETLICKKLPKPTRVRLGNWEVASLSKAQLEYAATDAFASWYMYEVLKKFPDPSSNKNEELETVAAEQPLAVASCK